MFTLWLAGMACLLMVGMSPARGDGSNGYPVSYDLIVGLGIVIGAVLLPSTGGPFLAGLLTVAAVGVSPILADWLMDVPAAGAKQASGGEADNNAGGASTCAGLAATAATMGITT